MLCAFVLVGLCVACFVAGLGFGLLYWSLFICLEVEFADLITWHWCFLSCLRVFQLGFLLFRLCYDSIVQLLVYYFVITFDYLVRGGFLGWFSAWLVSLLG